MSEGEVLPGVHKIDTNLGERLSSLYLFVGDQRAVLFDTGVDGTIPDVVLPYLHSVEVPVEHVDTVVVSHCDVDHFGGIADAHDCLPAAQIVAHELDADAMESFEWYERDRGRSFRSDFGFDEGPDEWARSVVRTAPVSRRVAGDFALDLGDRALDVLHVPGHSRGHLSIYDAKNSFIAISDAILGEATPLRNGDPAFPPTYRHERDYLNTIDRVESLNVDLIGTAHYGCLGGVETTRFLNLSREFARDLKALVLETIRHAPGGLGLADLSTALDPVVGAWPKGVSLNTLKFPIAGHLEQLEAEGVICRRVQSGVVTFVDNTPVALHTIAKSNGRPGD